MTSRDFCYWLQGFIEISGAGNQGCLAESSLTVEQVKVIRSHLAMVFKHEIDPSAGSVAHQDELNTLHNHPPGAPIARC